MVMYSDSVCVAEAGSQPMSATSEGSCDSYEDCETDTDTCATTGNWGKWYCDDVMILTRLNNCPSEDACLSASTEDLNMCTQLSAAQVGFSGCLPGHMTPAVQLECRYMDYRGGVSNPGYAPTVVHYWDATCTTEAGWEIP